MSTTKQAAGVVAVACVTCCAGPIVGVMTAIGVGTVIGVAALGIAGLTVVLLVVPVLIRRRRARRQTNACGAATPQPVPVALGRRALLAMRRSGEPSGAFIAGDTPTNPELNPLFSEVRST
jgi:hypothetical protein